MPPLSACPAPFGHYKSQPATRCKVLSHEKVCTWSGTSRTLHSPWPRPSLRPGLQLQLPLSLSLSAARTHYYTLSVAEIRQNFPFGRRPRPAPAAAAARLVFHFFFFFGFSLLFICHNSVPKRAAVFPRVALFLVVVVAFITFRFIHLFRCSLLAVRCCLHSFRTRRFNSTFDSFFPFPVSLSSVSLHISRFAFGNKANSSKPGLMRHSDEYCIRLRSLESYECWCRKIYKNA